MKRVEFNKAIAKKHQLDALTAVTAPARLTKKALRKQNKERVAHLERNGFSRKQAEEVITHTDKLAPEGDLTPGKLVQFYHLGLRVGYIADIPHAGAVRIQPLGPKGAEQPGRVTVRLADVHQVEEQYTKHGENTMTAIAKKAAELTQQATEQREAKATKLAENLAKATTAKKAKAAAPKQAATTTVLATKDSAKEVKAKVAAAKKSTAKKSAPKKAAGTEQEWKFIKVGPATGQRGLILEVLKAIGGKATRSKLEAALAKKLDSSQEAGTVLSLKKKFLVDNGCVSVS